MHLVFTRMPSESYQRWLRSLLLYLCYEFWVLINSLVCWFSVWADEKCTYPSSSPSLRANQREDASWLENRENVWIFPSGIFVWLELVPSIFIQKQCLSSSEDCYVGLRFNNERLMRHLILCHTFLTCSNHHWYTFGHKMAALTVLFPWLDF